MAASADSGDVDESTASRKPLNSGGQNIRSRHDCTSAGRAVFRASGRFCNPRESCKRTGVWRGTLPTGLNCHEKDPPVWDGGERHTYSGSGGVAAHPQVSKSGVGSKRRRACVHSPRRYSRGYLEVLQPPPLLISGTCRIVRACQSDCRSRF